MISYYQNVPDKQIDNNHGAPRARFGEWTPSVEHKYVKCKDQIIKHINRQHPYKGYIQNTFAQIFFIVNLHPKCKIK